LVEAGSSVDSEVTAVLSLFKVLTVPFVVACAVTVSWNASAAVSAAGTVDRLSGTATATSAVGVRRDLDVGDKVFARDRIRTAEGSRVRLVFLDKSRMTLGPETDMEVESFSDDKKTRSSSFSTRFFKGAFRFVTGLIGRRNPASVRVRLPVATIGIRGTHFGAELDETSAKVMLLDPEENEKATAIEVANKYGQVVVEEPGYGTEIPDQFSPPSPVRRMQLRTVQQIMRVMRKTTRPRGVGTTGR
jgi:hypothetical protein